MPGGLEGGIKDALDVFPDRVAVGTDDHAALDAGVFDQLGLFDDVGIPAGKVLVPAGDGLDLFFFCHRLLPPKYVKYRRFFVQNAGKRARNYSQN